MTAEVSGETAVTVPIASLFDDLRERIAASDRVVAQRLDSQDNLLRRIDKRQDQAATKADVERMEIHLKRHDDEISELRETVHENEVEKSFKNRLKNQLGWFVAAIMVPLGAALILVVSTHKG